MIKAGQLYASPYRRRWLLLVVSVSRARLMYVLWYEQMMYGVDDIGIPIDVAERNIDRHDWVLVSSPI